MVHVILHFDINGTLIIHDNAGGKTKSVLINGILMQSIFGRIRDETYKRDDLSLLERAQSFEIVSQVPSVNPPSNDSSLLNYHSFMEHYLLPFASKSDTTLSMEQRLKLNHETKQLRKQFTAHIIDQGYPLFEFAKHKQHLFDQVKHVNILPSFFRCILTLLEEKQSVSIVFRSFGDMHDFEMVCNEFNLFCEGKHPQFSNLKTEQIQQLQSFKLDPHQHVKATNESIGFFFQNAVNQLHLIVGSLQRPKSMDTTISMPIEEHLKQIKDVQCISGYKSIHQFLMTQFTKPFQSFCFRDYYYYWNANNEHGEFGKQMFVNVNDAQNYQLFFDDNIEMADYPTQSILSIRDENGVILNVEKYHNIFAKHIYCFESIQKENYFYEALQEKLNLWRASLQ